MKRSSVEAVPSVRGGHESSGRKEPEMMRRGQKEKDWTPVAKVKSGEQQK